MIRLDVQTRGIDVRLWNCNLQPIMCCELLKSVKNIIKLKQSTLFGHN